MAQYWILKSEPSSYGFPDLVRERRARWDGIRNAAALKHLRSMREGDGALIYHTGDEKALVGLARIAGTPYADPSRTDPRLVVVDVEAGEALPRPVPLAEIKADPAFKELGLVRISRLSVVPVEPAQWKKLLAMGGASTT